MILSYNIVSNVVLDDCSISLCVVSGNYGEYHIPSLNNSYIVICDYDFDVGTKFIMVRVIQMHHLGSICIFGDLVFYDPVIYHNFVIAKDSARKFAFDHLRNFVDAI